MKIYRDGKLRTRWVHNHAVAVVGRQVSDYPVIGGNREAHAARYARIANAISHWPDCFDLLARRG